MCGGGGGGWRESPEKGWRKEVIPGIEGPLQPSPPCEDDGSTAPSPSSTGFVQTVPRSVAFSSGTRAPLQNRSLSSTSCLALRSPPPAQPKPTLFLLFSTVPGCRFRGSFLTGQEVAIETQILGLVRR